MERMEKCSKCDLDIKIRKCESRGCSNEVIAKKLCCSHRVQTAFLKEKPKFEQGQREDTQCPRCSNIIITNNKY